MNYFYSTAFTECIHRHEIQTLAKSKFDKTLIVKVQAPQLRPNQRLALSGSVPELGNWQEREALKCLYTGDNEWTAVIDATNLIGKAIEMKYIVEDEDLSVPVIWEARMNRVLHIPEIKSGKTETISIEMAHFPIPADRIAGTAIPIFSLRSEGSFGVGDFGDLKGAPYQRHYHNTHMVRLLSIFLNKHLRPSSAIYRFPSATSIEGRKESCRV